MRLFALLALFPFSAALTAQTMPANSPAVVLQTPPSANCPVSFSARRAQEGGLVTASPSAKTSQPGYRITFSPGSAGAIAEARITLHGISGHQVIPAGKSASDSSNHGQDVTEHFNLSPSSGVDHLFHATIHTEKLTGVQWVELNELTYANGSSWHQSSTTTCRVAPNGYMLVADSR